MILRFDTCDFSVPLPWFYFDDDFSRARPSPAWSFEVNGLTQLRPGNYDLRFFLRDPRCATELSWDGKAWESCGRGDGYFDVPNRPIANFMLSCYWKRRADEAAPPVEALLLAEAGSALPAAPLHVPPYKEYVRDTRIEDRTILTNWESSYKTIRSVAFGRKGLRRMFLEMAEWIRKRQVLKQSDVHCGAIYSEEDKYDFQDAAAAAVVLYRMYRWTSEAEWRDRTLMAKSYVWKGQHRNESNPERFGGFPSMRAFETPDFTRLAYPLPAVSGVATCIIGNLMVKLFEEGLPPGKDDLACLRHIGTWVENSESAPGVFRHHEGDERGKEGYGDCQNSNALGAGALVRIGRFLSQHGEPVPETWERAVRRGFERGLSGQEAIGVWPYLYAGVGRGQAYSEQSVPDHGMGLYHLLQVADDASFRDDRRLHDALRRAARWYLCTSYIEPETGLLNLQYDPEATGLAFSSFTWCRFMCAASLFRIARITGERQPWRNMALKLMEYVRRRLWNSTDPERAPVVRSCLPDLKRVTWIHAIEWDAVLLLELIDALDREGKETNSCAPERRQ